MEKLNRGLLTALAGRPVDRPPARLLGLPEKVLQFGTGVLLRGLPDALIDAANRAGIFNGRIVMVKSTDAGPGPTAYETQDMLFTHCRRGLKNGRLLDAASINASISRVLPAAGRWPEVLACAENPEIRLVISNTTEAGLRLADDDDPGASPPASFPAKLLAVLHRRFLSGGGRKAAGLVILPTELVENPGRTLRDLTLELARRRAMAPDFIDWLGRANHFCDTLVDRIVPGGLSGAVRQEMERRLGYQDPLLVMSEPYGLWAIEAGAPAVLESLAFAAACPEVVVTDDISRFRELKLRLLNGSHTFACGLAMARGFSTVREAIEDAGFALFLERLMVEEIVPCLPAGAITKAEAVAFAGAVLERFKNPFLEHAWQKIAGQYFEKMRARNIPLLLRQREVDPSRVPERMALGFAGFLFFIRSSAPAGRPPGQGGGRPWPVEDERAAWWARIWRDSGTNEAVDRLLADDALWGTNLGAWPAFAGRVKHYLNQLLEKDAAEVMAAAEARSGAGS